MKHKLFSVLLFLLASCMLISSCAKNPKLDPSQYDLPEDAITEVRRVTQWGKVLFVVKQQPEKTAPITLPESEDFALLTTARRAFFGIRKKGMQRDLINHVRYSGKYYIRYFDHEWIYAPDGDGQFTLWERKGENFRRTKTRKSEDEVKAWFFTDLSPDSVSIAMIHGVWGEPTGKTKKFCLYDYNKRGHMNESEVYVDYEEYDFHGILQYLDSETGLSVATYSCPQFFGTDCEDIALTKVFYISRAKYNWEYITPDMKEPVLEEK